MRRRRDFIRAWRRGSGVATREQRTTVCDADRRIFGSETPERFATRLSAFRQGLSATGFDEGRNVSIEYRWGNGQIDQFPALAADLVRHKVSVIATPGSGVAALAAKAATTTIPIVFETGLDPVSVGLVGTLSRPEANVTGITSLNVTVGLKGLELLHELVPKAKSLAVLVNPANPVNTDINVKSLEAPVTLVDCSSTSSMPAARVISTLPLQSWFNCKLAGS